MCILPGIPVSLVFDKISKLKYVTIAISVMTDMHQQSSESHKMFLTYLCQMYFPIRINWTCPFPILGLMGGIYHFLFKF